MERSIGEGANGAEVNEFADFLLKTSLYDVFCALYIDAIHQLFVGTIDGECAGECASECAAKCAVRGSSPVLDTG